MTQSRGARSHTTLCVQKKRRDANAFGPQAFPPHIFNAPQQPSSAPNDRKGKKRGGVSISAQLLRKTHKLGDQCARLSVNGGAKLFHGSGVMLALRAA